MNFATVSLYVHGIIQNFKSDMHWGTLPTVSVLTGVQAGVALTTAATYNGPEDCCLFCTLFNCQYLCKCENSDPTFHLKALNIVAPLTINAEPTHFSYIQSNGDTYT